METLLLQKEKFASVFVVSDVGYLGIMSESHLNKQRGGKLCACRTAIGLHRTADKDVLQVSGLWQLGLCGVFPA